jgi:hypothetical protein
MKRRINPFLVSFCLVLLGLFLCNWTLKFAKAAYEYPNWLKESSPFCAVRVTSNVFHNILIIQSGGYFHNQTKIRLAKIADEFIEAFRSQRINARIIVCNFGVENSEEILAKTDQILQKGQLDLVIYLGLGADRFLNDPRQPWLSRNPNPRTNNNQTAAPPQTGAWKQKDHFIAFRPRTARHMFSFGGPDNWRKGVPQAALEATKDGGWFLTTDKSKSHYQLKSRAIEVLPGRPLVLDYKIHVQAGGFRIGILSIPQNRFFASFELPEGKQIDKRVEFTPPDNQIQLILHNNLKQAGISRAEIRHLELFEKDQREKTDVPVFTDPDVMSFSRLNIRRLIEKLSASSLNWLVSTYWTPIFSQPISEQRKVLAKIRTGPIHTIRQARLYSRIYDDMLRDEMQGHKTHFLDLGYGEPSAAALTAMIANILIQN